MEAAAYTDDRLLNGRVVVRQPRDGYRTAIDPVILAAAVRARAGEAVLDAGCGTGAAMFCLAARVPGLALTGLEQQPVLAAFAEAGVALNDLTDHARVVVGDLAAPPPEFEGAFDIVATNPPFESAGTASPEPTRAAAHKEGALGLAGWIKVCFACLAPRGRFVMIHRADRLSEILGVLQGLAGDIHILPLFPKAGEPARRVIVDAGKGRRSPDVLLPGLVLHEADGTFTPAAQAILRDGEGLY